MKSTSTLIIALIMVFFHLSSNAQNATEKNILGCWELKKMEFIVPNENSAQLDNEAKNTVLCFNQNGKFTTKKNSSNSIVLNGAYRISPDEKTIYQNREIQNQRTDEELVQIILLNEKEFVVKSEYAILYFKRI